MKEKKGADAQAWLKVGARDLAAARKLASGEDPNLNYASYFCQQAAEKAVKALLAFNGVQKGKWLERGSGHDISDLIQLATPFDPNIDSRAAERNLLNLLPSVLVIPISVLSPARNSISTTIMPKDSTSTSFHYYNRRSTS